MIVKSPTPRRRGSLLQTLLLPSAAATLLWAVLMSVPGYAQSPHELQVMDVDTGAVIKTVTIDIPGDATGASSRFFLSQTSGSTPLDGVQLSAIVAGISATFSAAGQQGDTFVVPPAGQKLLVTVTISGITNPVTRSGALIAIRNGDAASIATVVVNRAASAALTIIGATDAEGIKVAATTADFSRTLTIVSNTTATIGDLQLRIRPLVAEDGTQVQPAVDVNGSSYRVGAAIVVPSLGSIAVTLAATLPTSGTYTGGITLVYGTTQKDTKVVVERTATPPTITIDDIQKVGADIQWESVDVELVVSLRENAGHAITLTEPQLVSLVRQVGTDNIQADPIAIQVDDLDHGLLRLKPYEPRKLTVHIRKLRHPGLYTGNLRFSSPNGPPVDTAFTLIIKRGWWLVVVLVLVGSIVSFLLHLLIDSVRPRLEARLRALQISVEIERLVTNSGGPNNLTAATVGSLQASVAELAAQTLSRRAKVDVVMTQLDNLDFNKIPMLASWLGAARRVLEFGQPTPTELKGLVDKVGAYLANIDSTDADLVTARQDLGKLIAAIANHANAVNELQYLDDSLRQWLSVHPSDDQTASIQSSIATARSELANGTAAAAQAGLAVARKNWADLLASQLESLVIGDTPPVGVGSGPWRDLQGEILRDVETIRNAATVRDATSAYNRGYARLLSDLIGALKSERVRRSPPDSVEIRNLDELLDKMLTEVAAGDLLSAQQDYEQALAIFRQAFPAPVALPRAVGVEAGEQPSDRLLSISPGLKDGPRTPPVAETWIAPTARSFPSVRATALQLFAVRVVISLFVAAIAALLGVAVIWSPNATWGVGTDYIFALLWGLGLQPVGTTTFQGFLGLQNLFRGQTTPAAGGNKPAAS